MRKEGLVLRKLVETLDAYKVKDSHRVVAVVVPYLGIDFLEKSLGTFIPAPPEVLGKGLEARDGLRKVTGHHHALPGRGVYCNIVDAHIYVEIGFIFLVKPSEHFRKCLRIGLVIILYLLVPQCDVRNLTGVAHVPFHRHRIQGGNLFDPRLHGVHDLVVVRIVPLRNRDSRIWPLAIVVPHPEAEARERGGEGRDAERERLKRRVAPRLVIGREHRQVHTHEQVIVAHSEYAVVAVEVGRDEVDTDLAV